MNVRMFKILLLCNLSLQASLWKFNDSSLENRFLGLGIKVCATVGVGDQKSYDAGNDTISSLLNLNFLDPSLLGQQFYIFNDFMNWLDKKNQTQKTDGQEISSSGVYMIVIGTSDYLKQMVAPKITCPSGQQVVYAQLKFIDPGKSVEVWSQDSICLAPTDRFSLKISSDQDSTSIPSSDANNEDAANLNMQADVQGITWMKDAGQGYSYGIATKSPRTIRLIKEDN